MQSKFEKILSPGIIGKLHIKNRMVMSPVAGNFATTDGIVTRRLLEHYENIAKGGAGLVIVEGSYIHAQGKALSQLIGIYHEKCIPGLNEIAETVNRWGAKAFVQLNHAGRQTNSIFTGIKIVAPSAIQCPTEEECPRELTTEEVEGLVERYAKAAKRAKAARFDGVELLGAHGYLINQFLSPKTNHRTDKYGGDFNRRMTFLLEIIKRIKDETGADFPLSVRMNASDLVEGGLTLDDVKKIAQTLQKAGVDVLNITAGMYETLLNPSITGVFGIESIYARSRGQLVNFAKEIKKITKIPIITIGAISPEWGEEILQKGQADFIAIGRGLLADPQLPNKVGVGKPDDIRRCIRCNEGCISRLFADLPIRCVVNAEIGSEGSRLTPTLRCKKVSVIGGGPAGMEAARVAALRGHEVTLYEKSEKLGGHMIAASVPDFKEELKLYNSWLSAQIKKLGVIMELGKEATAKMVKETRPDVVIVATGSTLLIPPIPGIDKPIAVSAIDVLLGKAKLGNNIIVIGGGLVGPLTALFLALNSKRVIIVDMLPEIAMDIPALDKGAFMTSLRNNNVEILTSLKISEITDNGIVAVGKDKTTRTVNADNVVIALGLKSNAKLHEELKNKVPELYAIGDCVEPRKIGNAIQEGYAVGRTI